MIDVAAIVLDIDFMLENSPVFQAQVGEQVLAWTRAGLRAALVTTVRDAERFETVIGRRLRTAGVQIVLSPHGRLGANLLRLARATRRLYRDDGLRCAYARGIWGRIAIGLAVPSGAVRYVYDVRGALGDETRAGGSAAVKARIFRGLERESVRHASAVTAVSRPLAGLLRSEYGREDVTVIPSCVTVSGLLVSESERLAARAECGFGPRDVVLTYCGGIDHYQRIPEMLQLWAHLQDEPAVRFLLITNDAPNSGGMVGDLARLGNRLLRRSVPRPQVPRLLAAADIGFMLRENRVMNLAASPVKFAEYLAAGLAVVSSPGVGDVSDLVRARDLGILVGADPSAMADGVEATRRLVDAVRAGRDGYRDRARTLALERYDWDAYLPAYRQMYGLAAAIPETVPPCAAS